MKRVEISGGYQFACRRIGSGFPVVFCSSVGSAGSNWYETIEHVKEPITGLLYNRARILPSDPRPEPKTLGYRQRADELGRLLDALDFPRPAINVGHSIGALYGRLFASQNPDQVAGFVLVDSSLEGQRPFPGGRLINDGLEPPDTELGARELQGLTPPLVPAAVVSQRPGNWEEQIYHYPPGSAELWSANQRRLVAMLGAEHYVSTHSGHNLPDEDPELVAEAIDGIVRQTREV